MESVVLNQEFQIVRDECLKELIKKGYIRVQPKSYLKVLLKQRGYDKVCIWCGNKLLDYRYSYCTGECSINFDEYRTLPGIRYRLIKERGYNCEHCKEEDFYVEMHHIIPISEGGDIWDDNNLELLCQKCHIKNHKELYIEKKRNKLKIKPLSVYGIE
jgi:5-methylcytosine-specific restriction endonuclease McrA